MTIAPALPELELSGSRRKTVLNLVGSITFVVIGIAMLRSNSPSLHRHGPPPALVAWFAILFFGLCGLALVVQLVRPNRLRLTDDGFIIVTSLGRMTSKRWSEIDEFRMFSIQSSRPFVRPQKFVVWSCETGTSVLRSPWAERRGYDGVMPRGWEIDSDELCKLLSRRLDNYRVRTAD